MGQHVCKTASRPQGVAMKSNVGRDSERREDENEKRYSQMKKCIRLLEQKNVIEARTTLKLLGLQQQIMHF